MRRGHSHDVRILVDLVSRTWVIVAVTIVICTWFLARAASSILEAEAFPDEPASTVRVTAQPALPPPAKLDGTKITRNIFCSTCEPTAVASAPERYAGEPAVLIATMLGPDPRATVRVLASEAQGSWGVGERIPGVGMIDRIGSTSIDVVDVAGHRGTISLLDAAAAGAPAKSERTDAATSVPGAAADPFADSVKKIADNDYEVTRQLVRDLVSGSSKPGGVRILPVQKGTDMQLRLAGVRPGSVASALGLKSGDLITQISGEPIKHVQQLLDLYAKIDNIDAVELAVTRAQKPMNLTLRLR